MDTLESMRAFVRVVELGGFSQAARVLGLSASMVTKHVAHLEGRTGVRLLHRSTRHVRPTEAGEVYYRRAAALLEAVEEAEGEAGRGASAPTGTLRLTAPVEFGNAHLAPLVTEFLGRHPAVGVSLDLDNRVVNLVEEGYDLAIRIAGSLDTSLIGRRIATSRFLVVASPAYLERKGRPAAPGQLVAHDCMTFAVPKPWDEWPFARDKSAFRVKVACRMLSSSSEALRLAAVGGAGVAWLPSFVCGVDVAAGRLVSLFPEYESGALGVHALYASRRFLPVRARLFLDLLAERFGPDPEADPWLP